MSDADAAAADAEAAAQQELRLKRRAALLAELAEARALRRRVMPRRVRLARERAIVHASLLRR